MAKGRSFESDGAISMGSEAWNVADGFVKLKILRQLIQLDRYDTLAQFGTEEVDQDLTITPNELAKRRIEAFQRFVSTLKQLMGNVKFALDNPNKTLMESFEERIKQVEEVMDQLYEESENQVTHEKTLVINEKLFGTGLKILQNIKDDLNTPLNDASLIFRASDDFDLDAVQREIEEGG
jgi:lysyl-tRNA synthetase class I